MEISKPGVSAVPIPSQTATRRFGTVLSAVVIVCAFVVLVLGWGFEVDAARRIMPQYPAMVPATALTLVAGSLGTLALHRRRPPWQPVTAAVTLFVIVVLEQVASLTPGTKTESDGMSLASIASALLLGASLMLRTRSRVTAAVVVDTLGLVVTTVPLIGYLFGSATLYGNPLYTQMALHTALCHAILFVALLLASPRRGWIAVLLGDEPGSVMARRVVPVAIVIPLILSLIASMAVKNNLMTVEFRLAVLTFLIIASTVVAVLGFANLTNRAERRNAMAQAAYLNSERRRQEVELAAARSEKVTALGKLVGGVAHDFNNTLNVILGNLELLREDPDRKAHEEYVADAIAASHRAAALTRQLLAYGRKSRLDPVRITVAAEIDGALSMFRRVCPSNIALHKDFGEGTDRVRLDPDAFQQAILNVLINARDALPQGGTIHIATRTERLDGAAGAGYRDDESLPAGAYVTVRFADDGIGMSPEIAARATEPFFTTKKIGEGTGLGLSSVAGFCLQSGGGLRIDSTEGVGTTITMAFPVCREAPATDPGSAETFRHGPMPD